MGLEKLGNSLNSIGKRKNKVLGVLMILKQILTSKNSSKFGILLAKLFVTNLE